MNPERLESVKASIHAYLSEGKVYDSIRDIVESYISDNPSVSSDQPDEIMNILKERGIFQTLLSSLSSDSTGIRRSCSKWGLVDGERYLHVRLNGGRAFVDNIEIKGRDRYNVFVALHFGYQRQRSAAQPCICEPSFDDDFLLHLDPSAFGFPPDDLLEISTPLHIAVFREDLKQNTCELIGENVIDWRKALNTGFLGVTVELCGSNVGVPSGILNLEMEIIPKYNTHKYTEDEIAVRLDQQRAAITAADREFLLYARRWWNEYQSFRPIHRNRKVKVFASTTSGRMVPVTHFISPLQGDGINSPFEAARFVSLLLSSNSPNNFQGLEGSEGNQWLSTFVFLSQRQGHPSNHANLLCSLLLGFGLDSYCCIGSNISGEVEMFVISHINGPVSDIVIWIPLVGERYNINGNHSIKTVDCIYNHKCLYANVQQSSDLSSTSFDVENEELWKPINPLKLRLVPKFPNAPLIYEPAELGAIEKGLELRLRTAISSHRDALGIQTVFHDHLSYILSQALVKYEQQKTTCIQEDLTMFQNCVKGTVGPGMTFKAIPINTTNVDEGNIMSIVLSHSAGMQILDTVGEDVKFGIRVKVFSFPECVFSVWIMLGVSYRIRV